MKRYLVILKGMDNQVVEAAKWWRDGAWCTFGDETDHFVATFAEVHVVGIRALPPEPARREPDPRLGAWGR